MNKNEVITVTEAAKKRIATIIKEQNKGIQGIRARVDGATPTDFRIRLGFEKAPEPNDIIVECDTFKVFIDAQSVENIKGSTIDFVEGPKQSGFKIDNPNKPDFGLPKAKEGLFNDPRAKKMNDLILEKINPAIADHGGVITLLDVKNDTIYIHMGGGCQGCAQSQATLKDGVVKMIQESFPEIKEVIDTTDHASGKNPYFKPSS